MFKKILTLTALSLLLSIGACSAEGGKTDRAAPEPEVRPGHEVAIFAGGCFWCMEPPFEKLDGVKAAISGYIGGGTENPNYKNYAQGGHVEAVEVLYDPNVVSYRQLLDAYWRSFDPTDSGGQFGDRGPQYRPAIFYLNDEQKEIAEESRDALDKTGRFDKPITVEVTKATRFYPAEEDHQDYYKKNPYSYKLYRFNSGRDGFLEKFWGKK